MAELALMESAFAQLVSEEMNALRRFASRIAGNVDNVRIVVLAFATRIGAPLVQENIKNAVQKIN